MQLLWSASQMLYRFPSMSLDPRKLLGELCERLARFLAGHDVTDRRYFFNTACRRLRYLLLDLARKPVLPMETTSACDDLLDVLEDPAQQAILNERKTLVQRALRALDQLDPALQEIIHYHVILGMSFREIERECGIPRATGNDRYRGAIVALERLVAGNRRGAACGRRWFGGQRPVAQRCPGARKRGG